MVHAGVFSPTNMWDKSLKNRERGSVVGIEVRVRVKVSPFTLDELNFRLRQSERVSSAPSGPKTCLPGVLLLGVYVPDLSIDPVGARLDVEWHVAWCSCCRVLCLSWLFYTVDWPCRRSQ